MLTYNKKKTTILQAAFAVCNYPFHQFTIVHNRTDPPFEVWNDAKEQYKLFADSGIKSGSGFSAL